MPRPTTADLLLRIENLERIVAEQASQLRSHGYQIDAVFSRIIEINGMLPPEEGHEDDPSEVVMSSTSSEPSTATGTSRFALIGDG